MPASDPNPDAEPIRGSQRPLHEAYDVLLVDLDGVVYLGPHPIPGASAALRAARSAGARIGFVTNNAARPPEQVAEQLRQMDVAASPEEVMTSAVAAAELLSKRLPAGAPVLVVGGAGIEKALRDNGLEPVDSADAAPAAVLQGFAPEVGWRALAEAAVAIRAGAEWVATNADVTLPSPRGPLPGNGALVAALATATGSRPEVVGKPEPALFRAALAQAGGDRPLVVGDRLDTDIAGATAAGLPSLLVLSGVSTPRDLLAAPAAQRPTYLGRDLGALGLVHPGADRLVAGATASTPDGLDPLRRLAAEAWRGDLPPGQYMTRLESLDLTSRESP